MKNDFGSYLKLRTFNVQRSTFNPSPRQLWVSGQSQRSDEKIDIAVPSASSLTP